MIYGTKKKKKVIEEIEVKKEIITRVEESEKSSDISLPSFGESERPDIEFKELPDTDLDKIYSFVD